MDPQVVLDFWFKETEPSQHFKVSADFDALLTEKFGVIHRQATLGELAHFRQTIQGRLAEIIILDQFSRNIFRGEKQAFASDGMALVLAQEALKTGQVDQLSIQEKSFLYMPFMHSESLVIHQQAANYFDEPGLETTKHYEEKHRVIIERFGRYPHRNTILDRESTPEEITFLEGPDSSF